MRVAGSNRGTLNGADRYARGRLGEISARLRIERGDRDRRQDGLAGPGRSKANTGRPATEDRRSPRRASARPAGRVVRGGTARGRCGGAAPHTAGPVRRTRNSSTWPVRTVSGLLHRPPHRTPRPRRGTPSDGLPRVGARTSGRGIRPVPERSLSRTTTGGMSRHPCASGDDPEPPEEQVPLGHEIADPVGADRPHVGADEGDLGTGHPGRADPGRSASATAPTRRSIAWPT